MPTSLAERPLLRHVLVKPRPRGSKEQRIGHNRGTLAADRAMAIISTSFPQFRGRHAVFLAEGWDFQVFAVGADWLFRFPKREESAARLTKEYHLLSDLNEWVSLPTPDYRFFCESYGDAGWPFAGYKKIPGTPADVTQEADWPAVVRQLGLFLTQLHSYPVERARAAGVPEDEGYLARWRDESLANIDAVHGLPADRRALSDYLTNDLPGAAKHTPRLVHNDLWAEHILIDPHTRSVSGIIDWGDAVIGDPAVDLAAIYAWLGEQGLSELLAHYSGILAPDLINRVRYLATCLAIRNIRLGQDLGHARWIEAGRKALHLIGAT